MKKLLLISLVCLLIFGLAITAMSKVKVSYWTYPSILVLGLEPGIYEQRVIDEFEKLYPDVDIELEIIPYGGEGTKKVNLNIISKTPPDILADGIGNIGQYANAGLILPFELNEKEKDDFLPFAIEASNINGKMYYYPIGVWIMGLGVMKKIARDTGALELLPLDKPDRTWTADEFKAFLQKVASAKLPGTCSYAMWFGDTASQAYHIMIMMQGFGAVPFVFENGKYRCTLNSSEAVEGLEYYLDIYKDFPNVFPAGMENMTCFDAGAQYEVGKVASCGSGIDNIVNGLKGTYPVAVELELTLFPFPSKKGITNGSLLEWCGFGVFDNHDAERAKYAQLFVRYFCENAPDLLAASYNASPVRKSSTLPMQEFKDNPEIQFYLTELAKFSKDYGQTCPVYGQYKETFRAVMSGVFMGELTAKEGLDEVANKVNKLLDEFYAK